MTRINHTRRGAGWTRNPLTRRSTARGMMLLLSAATLVTISASSVVATDADDTPTLTLAPDRGPRSQTVIAYGEDFDPGTTVMLRSGKIGDHVFADVTTEPAVVESDGTFDVVLDQFSVVLESGTAGAQYRVAAITGDPDEKDPPADAPRAVATYTLTESNSVIPIGNQHFEQRWARTDKPVASGDVKRTWMWGPEPFTGAIKEYYLDAPGSYRTVQYFDKSRMEINDPSADSDSVWYVTNGLLAKELITGRQQIGDNTFENLEPAEIPVAGDPGSETVPTYATMHDLLDDPAYALGTVITNRLAADGSITSDSTLTGLDVTAYYYAPETKHAVAEPFWYFLNSEQPVYEDGEIVVNDLFSNPFYATGYPITEAYWVHTTVRGYETDILVQAFERRVLTYTPANEAGWQVESGNVGRHYYQWLLDSNPLPGD